jgi:hypothetical protein
MLTLLGNTLYWITCGAALAWMGLCLWMWRTEVHNPGDFLLIGVSGSGLLWMFAVACRSVLRGIPKLTHL